MKNEKATTTFILNAITDGSVECDEATKEHYVSKARHLLRDHDTGKFRPMTTTPMPMRHSGAVLPELRRTR